MNWHCIHLSNFSKTITYHQLLTRNQPVLPKIDSSLRLTEQHCQPRPRPIAPVDIIPLARTEQLASRCYLLVQ